MHGGGPQITAMLDRLGVETEFRGGLRVTTPEAMDVVRMVLDRPGATGHRRSDQRARLASPSDSPARTRTSSPPSGGTPSSTGEPVDIGLVGDVVAVAPEFVTGLLDDGLIPVVSSVARGVDGQVYNVNADTAAAALAVALGAEKLVVLTDVEGLFAEWPASDELISQLRAADLELMLPTLTAGMVPKMEACLRAVQGGVPRAHVLDGRMPHALLLEVFTAEGVGTMVLP